MRKIMAICLIFVMLFAATALAASKKTYKKTSKKIEKALTGEGVDWADQENIITANPLVFIGIFNAHYEMAMSDENGLGFNALFSWYGLGDWNWTTVGAGAEYNWYFQGHALNGWFAGPQAQITFSMVNYKYRTLNSSYEWVDKEESASSVFFGIGGHGGYRWIWDNGFTLDLQAGVIYSIGSSVTIAGATASGIGGIGFGPGVNLGYAW